MKPPSIKMLGQTRLHLKSTHSKHIRNDFRGYFRKERCPLIMHQRSSTVTNAPSCRLLTPSGRFEINKRICLSMSDFHKEPGEPSGRMWTEGTLPPCHDRRPPKTTNSKVLESELDGGEDPHRFDEFYVRGQAVKGKKGRHFDGGRNSPETDG